MVGGTPLVRDMAAFTRHSKPCQHTWVARSMMERSRASNNGCFFHSSVFLVFFKGIARNLSSRSPLANLLLLLSSLETNLRRVHALIHPAQNLFGKMMSQQKMTVETVRPTQAATERLFAFEDARCLSHDPNPLLEFFKNHRVIAQLELDGQEIKKRLALGYFRSPLCFWPHELICDVPISVCCRISAVDAAVEAHYLVLRERSIEYRVEKYPAMSASANYTAAAACACYEDYARCVSMRCIRCPT